MPFVLVRANPRMVHLSHTLEAKGLPMLVKSLPDIVATALSIPGTEGELTPEEIEVKVESFGSMDIHRKDIGIIIWANDYPERKTNLKDRQEFIGKQVRGLLASGTTGFVWVLLQPGSFGEFYGEF